jgi:hypothetical protein
MAGNNVTPIRRPKPRKPPRPPKPPAAPEEIDPIVARIFARKFPGVDLLAFRANRRGTGAAAWTLDWHVLVFEAPIDLVLSYGIADPVMIPQKPKRMRSSEDWCASLRRGDRIEIRRTLDDNFDRHHPLAVFGVWEWPILETAADRADHLRDLRVRYARSLPERLEGAVTVLMMAVNAGGTESNGRFALDRRSLARVQSIVSAAQANLLEVLKAAHVIDTQRPPPDLRLVRNHGVQKI